MDDFSVTPPYTGFLADRTYLQMILLDKKNTNEVMLERLGRYVKYMDYLFNKTYPYQSVKNKEFTK